VQAARGSVEPDRPPAGGLLGELAGADIQLKSLLLNFPEYARRYAQILKAPVKFLRAFQAGSPREFKQSIAFMLQGISLSFIILTMGWALPGSIASFAAVNLPLISGAPQADLVQYAQRVEAIGQTLPPDLARAWRGQGELMLATRVLPDDHFRLLLDRLGQLSAQNADLLGLAIDGSLVQAERFGGRGYMLTFFLALHPQAGALLYQTYQLASAGPRYALQPHVEFLLSALLLWYLSCAVMARLMPRPPGDPNRRAVFALGALASGFLNPLYQALRTLLRFYLALTLPLYIQMASRILTGSADPRLGALSGGVFPYENLALVVVQAGGALALLGLALGALTLGLRAAFAVSKARAFAAAGLGLGVGLGLTEAAVSLLALILAPTGLL
jgi:hypothetical protein